MADTNTNTNTKPKDTSHYPSREKLASANKYINTEVLIKQVNEPFWNQAERDIYFNRAALGTLIIQPEIAEMIVPSNFCGEDSPDWLAVRHDALEEYFEENIYPHFLGLCTEEAKNSGAIRKENVFRLYTQYFSETIVYGSRLFWVFGNVNATDERRFVLTTANFNKVNTKSKYWTAK